MLRRTPKRDNSRLNPKIAIRRWALAKFREPRVLELYAGHGELYRHVWHEAKEVVAVDKAWVDDCGRTRFVCDNILFMRAMRDELSRFNIVDFDAYGIPWRAIYVFARLRPLAPGERLVIVYTDFSFLRARLGRLEATLAALAGISPFTDWTDNRTALTFVHSLALHRIADILGAEREDFVVTKAREYGIYAAAAFVGRASAPPRAAAAAARAAKSLSEPTVVS